MTSLKKIELHLHLDGSISLDLASKLSGLSLSELKEKMIAPDKCFDLKDYLTRFDFPISLMQTRKNLELISQDLVNRLEKDNVIYAEIRFAPAFFTKKGLTYDEIIESILKGVRKNKKVKTNLILCLMRGMDLETNLQVIEIASKYLNKGVVALDLAGDEKKYKLKEYLPLFKKAKSLNIPFTIHAGEVDEIDLQDAINLGLKRIGHGVFAIKNDNLLKQIQDKNILLEICPTSNIQTNAFNSYKEHPVRLLYDKKININISTDNRTVSNTSLEREYKHLIKECNFTKEELKDINKNSLNYAFLNPKEKIKLLEELEK